MAFILFTEQSFIVYGLVLNLHFVLSADLSALNNAGIKKFSIFLFALPDSTRTNLTLFFLKLPKPGPTFIFSFRHTLVDTFVGTLFISMWSIFMHLRSIYTILVDFYTFVGLYTFEGATEGT